ncbi:Ankyrin-2 [Manis pentadactyla]|nr:Ankyrin-2 [Manis pentadactyla]
MKPLIACTPALLLPAKMDRNMDPEENQSECLGQIARLLASGMDSKGLFMSDNGPQESNLACKCKDLNSKSSFAI